MKKPATRSSLFFTTTLLVIALVLISPLYFSFGQESRILNAQQAITSAKEGGKVNVLYAGSLISVMETKVGPAFSHLGFDYRTLNCKTHIYYFGVIVRNAKTTNFRNSRGRINGCSCDCGSVHRQCSKRPR